MEGSIVFQDGGMEHNYPGSIAKTEGKKLFPKKPSYLMVTIGCGIQNRRVLTKSKPSCLHRFYNSSMKNIDPHHQYEISRLSDFEKTIRLDPVLNMEETTLDDVEAIAELQQKLGQIFKSDRVFRAQIKITAWSLIASLFYFEFEREPEPHGSCFSCNAKISCRYSDTLDLYAKLLTRYRNKAVFQVNNQIVMFKLPCRVKFQLPNLTRPFDVLMKFEDQEASITGFPDTAENLLDLQKNCLRGNRNSLKRCNDEDLFLEQSKKVKLKY